MISADIGTVRRLPFSGSGGGGSGSSTFVNVMDEMFMYSQYTPVTLFQLSCETWLLQGHGQHSMP